MTNFISNSAKAKIDQAWRDLQETFFEGYSRTITYLQKQSVYSEFNEDKNASFDELQHEISCIQVFSGSESGQVDKFNKGTIDLAEGFVFMFHYHLFELGLISVNGLPVFVQERDEFISNNIRYRIIGLNPQPGLVNDIDAYKIQFERQITHG